MALVVLQLSIGNIYINFFIKMNYLEINDTNKIAFCIGETTAVQARKYFETVYVANLPSVENLLESLNTYFSK